MSYVLWLISYTLYISYFSPNWSRSGPYLPNLYPTCRTCPASLSRGNTTSLMRSTWTALQTALSSHDAYQDPFPKGIRNGRNAFLIGRATGLQRMILCTGFLMQKSWYALVNFSIFSFQEILSRLTFTRGRWPFFSATVVSALVENPTGPLYSGRVLFEKIRQA